VIAVARPEQGPPLHTSSVSDPQAHVEHGVTPAPTSDSGVPLAAIGLAAVAGAAVTAGTAVVIRHSRQGAKPADA
jgi:hypothetical protein